MRAILLLALMITGCEQRRSICEKQCERIEVTTVNGEERRTGYSKYTVTDPYGQIWPTSKPLEGCVCQEEEKK